MRRLVSLLLSTNRKRMQVILCLSIGLFVVHRYTTPDYYRLSMDLILSIDFTALEDFESDRVEMVSRFFNTGMIVENNNDTLPLCPSAPPILLGNISRLKDFMKEWPWTHILEQHKVLTESGRFTPPKCKPRHKVAVIIPLRGRENQLRVLLSHMHPIWQRQQIDYQVYTITQAGNGLFNRAKLINIGVAEANKDRQYDCYVFHDVDLLLEDDRCLYWCDNDDPRHIAVYMDKFSYKPLSYEAPCNPLGEVMKIPYFGGVSMLTHQQFLDTNGFSNLYWGWGGEDDDIFYRFHKKGYTLTNPYGDKCSFRMIPHEHESSNAENDGRYSLLYYSIMRMEKDGYNTLRYKVLSKENMKLYTNITVDIGTPTKKMMDFISTTIPWRSKCSVKMPWF